MKKPLTGLCLAALIPLVIHGCATSDAPTPLTDAYKGEYYDRYDDYADIESASPSYENTDFDYYYPGKPTQAEPDGEITNDLANEYYQHAMSMSGHNPYGMIEGLYRAAEKGSGDAHYELARELTAGKNIDRNLPAAITHLNDAAALNHAEATRVLGLMHIRGDSMEVDTEKGLQLLEKAAKYSVRAERELGGLYKGKAYPELKDDEKAIKHLKSAYSKGDVESAYLLGHTYFESGNYIEALSPLGFAAGAGHEPAKRLMREMK
jgi:TPR repeat protein